MALNARLTDDDVIALLQTAYPETELEDIQGNDKIMGQYFTCVHHGRDVIRSHISLYNQEMESAGEEVDIGSTDEDREDVSGDEDGDNSGSDNSENEEEKED